MKRILFSFFFVGLTWVSQAHASNADDCTRIVERVGMMNVHRQWTGRDCYLSMLPMRGPGLVYRSYLITAEGQLMVFNSYGDGPISTDTGARVFYLFPRTGVPAVALVDNTLQVQMADKHLIMSFSPDNGFISGFSAGKLSEDPEVSRDNQGGVEIQTQGFLMLDVGFKLGDSPTSNPKRKSIFYDGHGKFCQVTNKEIFDYSTDDSNFKFSDEQLKAFLAQRCPALKVGF